MTLNDYIEILESEILSLEKWEEEIALLDC